MIVRENERCESVYLGARSTAHFEWKSVKSEIDVIVCVRLGGVAVPVSAALSN